MTPLAQLEGWRGECVSAYLDRLLPFNLSTDKLIGKLSKAPHTNLRNQARVTHHLSHHFHLYHCVSPSPCVHVTHLSFYMSPTCHSTCHPPVILLVTHQSSLPVTHLSSLSVTHQTSLPVTHLSFYLSPTCHSTCHPPVILLVTHQTSLPVTHLSFYLSPTSHPYLSPTCHSTCHPPVILPVTHLSSYLSPTCHSTCHPPVIPTCHTPVIPTCHPPDIPTCHPPVILPVTHLSSLRTCHTPVILPVTHLHQSLLPIIPAHSTVEALSRVALQLRRGGDETHNTSH